MSVAAGEPGSGPIPGMGTVRSIGLGAALAGGAICAAGIVLDRDAFFEGYLVSFVFWIGLALGSLGFLMLHHLVSGRWGFAVQRILEASASTLPLFIPLFLGVLWGIEHLFHWAAPGALEDAALAHKAPYLNVPFFVGRAALFLLVWSTMAYMLIRWSRRQDMDAGDGGATRRMQLLSGPGLVLYVLTVSFAHFDWVMSLEPHWYSTIVGPFFTVSTGLTALAFMIVALLWLRRSDDLAHRATPERFHELARLLIAFVMLWAYMSFSQYLIIWMANLPEENFWYLHRSQGGWHKLTVFIVVFQFALPFLLLKANYTKSTARLLGVIATLLLGMRVIDLLWWMRPSEHHPDFAIHWVDLGAFCFIGGLWLTWFCWQLGQAALLPRNDPRLEAQAHVH